MGLSELSLFRSSLVGDIRLAATGIGRPVEQHFSPGISIEAWEESDAAILRLVGQLLGRTLRMAQPSRTTRTGGNAVNVDGSQGWGSGF